MREEAYISDILVAGGGNDTTSGLQRSVALDSECAERDTVAAALGDGPIMGAPVVATGVGPRVGRPAPLRSFPLTLRRGRRFTDLGLLPTGSCLVPLPRP